LKSAANTIEEGVEKSTWYTLVDYSQELEKEMQQHDSENRPE